MRSLLPLVVAALLAASNALAQGSVPTPPVSQAQAATNGWAPSCTSTGRRAPAECRLEQRLVVQETGQTFLTLAVRISAPPAKGILEIQTPLGIYLPAGISLVVDQRARHDLALLRCDGNGCYASQPLVGDLLAQLTSGQVLHLQLHTAESQTVGLDIPLDGFADGYAAIR